MIIRGYVASLSPGTVLFLSVNINKFLWHSSAGEYWVGKKSLRGWRRLYQSTKSGDEVIIHEASCEQSDETDDCSITAFNEDLLCCHGKV